MARRHRSRRDNQSRRHRRSVRHRPGSRRGLSRRLGRPRPGQRVSPVLAANRQRGRPGAPRRRLPLAASCRVVGAPRRRPMTARTHMTLAVFEAHAGLGWSDWQTLYCKTTEFVVAGEAALVPSRRQLPHRVRPVPEGGRREPTEPTDRRCLPRRLVGVRRRCRRSPGRCWLGITTRAVRRLRVGRRPASGRGAVPRCGRCGRRRGVCPAGGRRPAGGNRR